MTNRPIGEIIAHQRLLALAPEATVAEACRGMHARRVGAVVVADQNGAPVGIFTGRDAVRCLATTADPASVQLHHVMTHNPTTIHPAATAIEALRLMRDGGFRHLPVVRDGRMVGILALEDFRGLELDRLEGEITLWERM